MIVPGHRQKSRQIFPIFKILEASKYFVNINIKTRDSIIPKNGWVLARLRKLNHGISKRRCYERIHFWQLLVVTLSAVQPIGRLEAFALDIHLSSEGHLVATYLGEGDEALLAYVDVQAWTWILDMKLF